MRPFRRSKAWPVLAVLLLGSFVACDRASRDGDNASATSSAPPFAVEEPSATPVDDPATEDVEVAGQNRAWNTKDYTSSETSGRIDRFLNAAWKSDMTMSDPRLTGRATIVFNSDQNDRAGFYRWWIYPTIKNSGGTWEGLDTGEIRPDGDHEGWGVYLGTGSYAGLEFHEHSFMGPGAATTTSDAFEVTGVIHDVVIDGWTLHRSFPAAATRKAVAALNEAWSTGDGDAAGDLYTDDAVYVDGDGSTTTGTRDIARLVVSAADVGFESELLPPLFVRGNYAAGAFHWTDDTGEGWMLEIFRLDGAGRIARHEVIDATA